MINKIGTDEVLKKYGISKYKLNKLVEHSPESIGFIGIDKVWNGRAYINKRIFNADVETTKVDIEKKLAEIKAEGEITTTSIINSSRRKLDRDRSRRLEEIFKTDFETIESIHKSVMEILGELEVTYELSKQSGKYKIYKSKGINTSVLIYEDRYEEIYALVSIVAYQYRCNDELEGFDYELIGANVRCFNKE